VQADDDIDACESNQARSFTGENLSCLAAFSGNSPPKVACQGFDDGGLPIG
jgi:hypothetical protein